MSFYTGLLLSSSTDESVQVSLAGTPEFFSHSGGTDAGFVTALYNDFLKRNPTTTQLLFWENELSSLLLTRDQVASMILGSSEYDTDLVESYYLQFLQRAPLSSELTFFSAPLNGGTLTDEQVIASLIGTDEYFALAQTTGQAQNAGAAHRRPPGSQSRCPDFLAKTTRLAFGLATTDEAAANLAHWDRKSLER